MVASVAEEQCILLWLRAARDRSVALGLSRLMFTLLLLGSTSAIAQTQTADRPTRIALDWLRTLRSNDMDKLAAASQVPFKRDSATATRSERTQQPI